jgi:hypothetical protein
MAYLRQLLSIMAERGWQDIVYIDESGFEPEVCRRYGWRPRGQKVFGDHAGHRRPRTSLITARRSKDFLAPMLFSGTADTALVNDWTRCMLCQALRPNSTLIYDHAACHKKKDLEAVAHEHGHHLLFLPPYRPDLNRHRARLRQYQKMPPIRTVRHSPRRHH